jgi:hypothetical protein
MIDWGLIYMTIFEVDHALYGRKIQNSYKIGGLS